MIGVVSTTLNTPLAELKFHASLGLSEGRFVAANTPEVELALNN